MTPGVPNPRDRDNERSDPAAPGEPRLAQSREGEAPPEPPPREHASPPLHRLFHTAMNSLFEILIPHEDPHYAQQAAAAAFEELDRLDRELSRFIPTSDVSQIHALRTRQSLRVGIATMNCLQLARQIHADTDGAFDPTIGHLLALWRSASPDRPPSDSAIAAALARTGPAHLDLDPIAHTVTARIDFPHLDMGAIGKGYALDHMAAVLRDWSIDHALLHAGQSSAIALNPPSSSPWSLALRHPRDHARLLATIHLHNAALSGSGLLLHGQHIIDPRTGHPATARPAAWAIAPTAAVSDAISTALMILSPDEVSAYCQRHPEAAALICLDDSDPPHMRSFGAWPRPGGE